MSKSKTTPKVTPVQTEITSPGPKSVPKGADSNNTDVVYQEVRLYIEGVQVPFEAISISQSMGRLPQADIQVPPQSGLMDICRYYSPKVHIFYEDLNYGGLRLLFWGHIVESSFRHSRAGSGSASIRFSVEHKNAVLKQLTLDYSGYIKPEAPGAAGEGANLTVNALNSQFGIIAALKGISGVQDQEKDAISPQNTAVADADETKLMKSHAALLPRFTGMVSVSMNFWNQLKKATYINERYNTIMAGMLVPLVEDGIGYFKRMSGHTSLESLVDKDRQQVCPHVGVTADVIVPPAMRVGLVSAVQAKLAVGVSSSALQFSAELTNFASLLETFYYSVNYEVVTLSSPAEVPINPDVNAPDYGTLSEDVMAIETIIKPQLPFYYAPTCNVIYPRMFHTIQVSQDERDIPSRVSATHDSLPTEGGTMGTTFRGPHTVRESVAYAASTTSDETASKEPNLLSTLSLSYNAPGRYEQGRGVNHLKIGLPWWLQTLSKDESNKASSVNLGEPPARDTPVYADMLSFAAAWQARNGYDVTEVGGQIKITRNSEKDMLNPYSPKSGTLPYYSAMFASVDYEFTKQVVQSRTGTVDCVFNPYIIPGYPMDVLDDSPNHPSFHAMCSSVTHSITSRSISTTVGMMAVQTYAELSNYYTPHAPPWLQTALKLVSTEGKGGEEYGSTQGMTVKNAGTLLFNAEGKVTADAYYQSTLGVRAADPSTLYDWTTGQILPQDRFDSGVVITLNKESIPTPNGGDANDFNTTVGNLRLVSRPVESRSSIEYKFKYKFVELTPENYTLPVIEDVNPSLERDRMLEPGASLFLEYMESRDFVRAVQDAAKGVTTNPNVNEATPDNFVPRWRQI